jgi:hypothetical protein
MLKVCTSYSKKVPTDQQYSSQQFHASVEVELSDALSPDQLQERIHQTFNVVKSSVEDEINGKPSAGNGNGGHGSSTAKTNGKATNAQIKFITSLATDQDIQLNELNQHVQDTYSVESLYELSKKDASNLVQQLQRKLVKIPARR